MIDGTGTLDALGPVPGSACAACADEGIVWLLGFEGEASDEPAPEVREVHVSEGRVGEALDVRPHRPVAVVSRSSSTWRSQIMRTTRRRRQPASRGHPVPAG